MAIRLLGNHQDVLAFGLAGLDVVECRSRGDMMDALGAASSEPHVALLILAPSVAALAPDLVARLSESTTLPIVVMAAEACCRDDREVPRRMRPAVEAASGAVAYGRIGSANPPTIGRVSVAKSS